MLCCQILQQIKLQNRSCLFQISFCLLLQTSVQTVQSLTSTPLYSNFTNAAIKDSITNQFVWFKRFSWPFSK